jgi:hypothetical protein
MAEKAVGRPAPWDQPSNTYEDKVARANAFDTHPATLHPALIRNLEIKKGARK